MGTEAQPLMTDEVELLASVLTLKIDGHNNAFGKQGVVWLQLCESEEVTHAHGMQREALLH